MKLNVLTAILCASGCVAALTSCAPQAFTMNVEMRYPSSTGISFDGKSVAVVYLDADAARDSVFNEYLANGFASSIEKDYFGGEQAVSLYRMNKNLNADYSDKDSLRHFVMETGDDIVFVFDAPEFGDVSISDLQESASDNSTYYTVSTPVKIKLYAYDSMNKADTVYLWQGNRKVVTTVPYTSSLTRSDAADQFWTKLETPGEQFGKASAKIFKPTWKAEEFTFIYYDSPQAWDTASQAAYSFKWKEAIEAWMTLLDTNNPMKRSCAEFNIAQACFLNGEYALALKWLDRSDADYPVSLSTNLRKQIQKAMH